MRCAARALATMLLFSGAARSQVANSVARAPTLTVERYPEHWSQLADPAARTGHWTERFKYIPLGDDGTFLTTGLEERFRYEAYSNLNWGSNPDDDYLWYRFMPYADLHVWKVRLFAQPMASAILGTSRPKSPVDTTALDVLQAFAQIDLPVAEKVCVRVVAGRRLVSLGAGRFIDTRYGPNVPQAFDGFETALVGQTRQVRLLYMRPGGRRQRSWRPPGSARRDGRGRRPYGRVAGARYLRSPARRRAGRSRHRRIRHEHAPPRDADRHEPPSLLRRPDGPRSEHGARMQVVEQAVATTGGLEDARLIECTRQSNFETVVGPVRFGKHGEWTESRVVQVQFQNVKGHGVEQFKDARTQVVVAPEAWASGDLIYPYAKARETAG